MQTEPPQLLVVNFYGGQSESVFTTLRINGRCFEPKVRKNMVERGSEITVASTDTDGVVQPLCGGTFIRKFRWSPQSAPDSFGRTLLQ